MELTGPKTRTGGSHLTIHNVPRSERLTSRTTMSMEGTQITRQLTLGMASGFAAVMDTDYDPIRRMARESERVDL